MDELLSADTVFDVVGAYRLSAAVAAMAHLGIPDVLATQPLDAPELAERLQVDAPLLERLLRMLASRGVLGVDASGAYYNSGLSGALVEGELRDMVLGWAALPSVFAAWGQLGESIRAGRPPFELVHGRNLHGFFEKFPDEGARYATAMSSTVDGFDDLARAIEVPDGAVVVSVGGGRGTELVPVLSLCPTARAVLFDLPGALEGASELLGGHSLADRVEIVGGDARSVVPSGDLFILSTVLRCLNDDDALQVLRACRVAASGPDATLNAVEMIIPDGAPTHPNATANVTAWVAYGGSDRTAAGWRALFDDADWTVERIVPLTDPFSLIVCKPVR
jgi:hypothetical protein